MMLRTIVGEVDHHVVTYETELATNPIYTLTEPNSDVIATVMIETLTIALPTVAEMGTTTAEIVLEIVTGTTTV